MCQNCPSRAQQRWYGINLYINKVPLDRVPDVEKTAMYVDGNLHRAYRNRWYQAAGTVQWVHNFTGANFAWIDGHVSLVHYGERLITYPIEKCRTYNPFYPDDYVHGHPGTNGSTTP